MLSQMISSFISLLIIIDPIALIPIFLIATADFSTKDRNRVAFYSCLISLIILIGFFFLGKYFLAIMSIDMDAFKIAGGLLILLTAIDMVFDKRTGRRKKTAKKVEQAVMEEVEDESSNNTTTVFEVAAFPIAIPFIAGPAAITNIMLLSNIDKNNYLELFMTLGILLLIIILCYVLLVLSGMFERHFSNPAIFTVITKLLGFILAALAAQYIIDGVKNIVLSM